MRRFFCFLEKKRLVLILSCFFLVQVIMHLNCDSLILDDYIFFSVLDEHKSIVTFLAERWNNWSSRLIIEGILCLTTHNIWIWRILDSFMMVVLAWSMSRNTNVDAFSAGIILSALLILLLPFSILRSTGWQATSLNYYWPLACTSFSLVPLIDSLNGRETPRVLQILTIPAVIFAANQEQMAALIVGISLIITIHQIMIKKKVSRLQLMIAGCAFVEIILMLLCPGNRIRSNASISLVNLRDYGQFTLVDKLSVGFSSTMTLLFYYSNPVLLGCLFLLTTETVISRNSNAIKIMSVLILFCAVAFPYLWKISMISPDYASYVLQLGPAFILDFSHILSMFLFVIIWGMMMALPSFVVATKGGNILFLISIVGFASRMAVCLSPTIIESGERTMLPFYGLYMSVTLYSFGKSYHQDKIKKYRMAMVVIIIMVLMNIKLSFDVAI